MSLLKLFCHVDGYWRQFSTYLQTQIIEHNGRRVRSPRLSVSEIILPRKDRDSFSPLTLSQLQGLLHRACHDPSQIILPRKDTLGKLPSIRGVDAHRAHSITGLLSALQRQL